MRYTLKMCSHIKYRFKNRLGIDDFLNYHIYTSSFGGVEVAIVKSTPEEAPEAAREAGRKAPSPKLGCPLLSASGWGCFRKGQNCHAIPVTRGISC